MLGREKCFARNTPSSQRKNFMKLAVNKGESAVNKRKNQPTASTVRHASATLVILNSRSSRPPLGVRKSFSNANLENNDYMLKKNTEYAEKQNDEKLSLASASVWES